MRLTANSYSHRWVWVNSLPVSALVFRMPDRTVVCANHMLSRLLGVPCEQLEGRSISFLVPEHLIPQQQDVRQWMETPNEGGAAGIAVELTIETADGPPINLVARMGPADETSQYVLLTLPGREDGRVVSAKLHEELDTYTREWDVLASVGRIASSPIDFASALAGFAAELNRAMPVSRIAVHQVNAASGALTLSYQWPAGPADGDETCSDSLQADEARERCVKGRQPLVAEWECAEKAEKATAVVAPLLLGNSVIGTLTIQAQGLKRPTARDVSLVGRLADQIAGAVHTARTYQEKQRETELRRTLAAVGMAASQDLELERVLERVANEIAELVRYDLMAVALAEPDRSALRVRYQVGAELQFSGYEATAGPDDRLQLRPKCRIVTSLKDEPEFAELAADGFQSLLEVSLGMHEEATAGYLALVSKDRDAFSRSNLDFMRHLAAHVTPAIQNALAHEQSVALAEAKTAEAKAEARSLELERLNNAKSQFLGVVSHELRTPLTSITAYAELLHRNATGNLTERQINQVAVISQSASHLKFLISDLLDVSRIESGNFSLENARIDLRSLTEEVAERLKPVFAEKEQELEVRVARGKLEVDGDRRRIAQVISNIAENASKYSPPGTAITLDVHRRKDEILISVTDSGIGISPEDQLQLFTPFFRANSELTRTEPGTGLGLSLVKKIAELHGGTVSVKSKPGEGSTFTVALHAAKAAKAA